MGMTSCASMPTAAACNAISRQAHQAMIVPSVSFAGQRPGGKLYRLGQPGLEYRSRLTFRLDKVDQGISDESLAYSRTELWYRRVQNHSASSELDLPGWLCVEPSRSSAFRLNVSNESLTSAATSMWRTAGVRFIAQHICCRQKRCRNSPIFRCPQAILPALRTLWSLITFVNMPAGSD